MNFIVHRVITMCRPSEFIAWIDHSGQSTVEPWVSFEVGRDQSTSVGVVSQLAGTTPRVAGLSFAKFIESNVKAWFDAFCHACDHVHSENQS